MERTLLSWTVLSMIFSFVKGEGAVARQGRATVCRSLSQCDANGANVYERLILRADPGSGPMGGDGTMGRYRR